MNLKLTSSSGTYRKHARNYFLTLIDNSTSFRLISPSLEHKILNYAHELACPFCRTIYTLTLSKSLLHASVVWSVPFPDIGGFSECQVVRKNSIGGMCGLYLPTTFEISKRRRCLQKTSHPHNWWGEFLAHPKSAYDVNERGVPRREDENSFVPKFAVNTENPPAVE